jgi:hypothetical protein
VAVVFVLILGRTYRIEVDSETEKTCHALFWGWGKVRSCGITPGSRQTQVPKTPLDTGDNCRRETANHKQVKSLSSCMFTTLYVVGERSEGLKICQEIYMQNKDWQMRRQNHLKLACGFLYEIS